MLAQLFKSSFCMSYELDFTTIRLSDVNSFGNAVIGGIEATIRSRNG